MKRKWDVVLLYDIPFWQVKKEGWMDHQHAAGTWKYSTGGGKYFLWIGGGDPKRNRNGCNDRACVPGARAITENAGVFCFL